MTVDEAVGGPQGSDDLLVVEGLVQRYMVRRPGRLGGSEALSAVDRVSFSVGRNEVVGLVGETGCGKTTLARSVAQLSRPVSGKVWFRGVEVSALRGRELRKALRGMQMIFQDPFSSLNPRMSVRRSVEEPLVASGWEKAKRRERARELLAEVGVDPVSYGEARPRELSGGQCQRVAIARALAAEPDLLICDEAVSSLDVSVQGQILNLLERLRASMGIACLFISHDIRVIGHLSDRIMVMYLGRICEVAPNDCWFRSPSHPYSRVLVDVAAELGRGDRRAKTGSSEPASALSPPSGCRFRDRCANAGDLCAKQEPPLRELGSRQMVACHYPLDPSGPSSSRPEHGAPRMV